MVDRSPCAVRPRGSSRFRNTFHPAPRFILSIDHTQDLRGFMDTQKPLVNRPQPRRGSAGVQKGMCSAGVAVGWGQERLVTGGFRCFFFFFKHALWKMNMEPEK